VNTLGGGGVWHSIFFVSVPKYPLQNCHPLAAVAKQRKGDTSVNSARTELIAGSILVDWFAHVAAGDGHACGRQVVVWVSMLVSRSVVVG
jgi:hypothetical protein